MEKNFNNIDDLFKEELGGYTETPPPMVWDALEKRLQGDDKRRVFPYRWMWYFTIVAFIALLGSSIAWMMWNRALSNTNIASVAATRTATPQSAPATGNKPAATSDKNEAPIAKHARKEHHALSHTSKTELQTNNTENADQNERTAAHETHVKRHTKHNIIPNKAQTKEDLYADTDDDQYIVGGANTQSYDAPLASTSNTAAFAIHSRSQHNIRVAETDPLENVRENNYGSSVAVNSAASKSAAHTHYDIDLDEEPAETPANQNAASHTPHSRKARATNTGIAKSTHAANHDSKQLAAVTSSHETTTDKTTNAQTANVTTAVVNKPKHVRHHAAQATAKHTEQALAKNTTTQIAGHSSKSGDANAQSVTDKTALASTSTNTRTSKPETTQPTADKKAVISGNDNSASSLVQNKTAPVTAVTASDKTTVEKTAPVIGAPVASANRPAKTDAAGTHKKHTAAKVEKTNSDLSTPTTPAAGVATKSVAPKTTATPGANTVQESNPVAGAKTKAKHRQPKTDQNQYAASKIEKITAPAKTATAPKTKAVTASGDVVTAQPKAKEEKTSEAIAAAAGVKKSTGHKTTAEKKQSQPGTQPSENATASTAIPAAAAGTKQPKKETARKGSGKTGTTTTPAVTPPVFNYSRSLAKRTVEEESIAIDNLKVNNFEASTNSELLPGTFKNDNDVDKSKAAGAVAKNEPVDSTAKHHFAKNFEAGIKGGIETGFNARAANKVVVEPYVQYNLSNKFSLLTQPSIKVSHVNSENVGDTRSYSDTSGGKYTYTGGGTLLLIAYVGGNQVLVEDSLRRYNYRYDSVVKSYSTGGTYMEIELPLLLKYKIGKGLSVYGGANSVFSKYTSIKENTHNYSGNFSAITIIPPGNTVTLPNTAALALPGKPIGQYSGPLYPTQKGSLLRMGYMLGFSYEYKKRWLFDALMQQAIVKPNNEAGVNTNAPLSMPYFRLTLGYKLTK